MITAYAGRGILSESQGPVWMVGTACAFTFLLSSPHTLSDISTLNGSGTSCYLPV
jgi:hypothetical protein